MDNIENLLNKFIAYHIDDKILGMFIDCFARYFSCFRTIVFDQYIENQKSHYINKMPSSYQEDMDIYEYIVLKVKEYALNILLCQLSISNDIMNEQKTNSEEVIVHYTFLCKQKYLDKYKSIQQLENGSELKERKKTVKKKEDAFLISLSLEKEERFQKFYANFELYKSNINDLYKPYIKFLSKIINRYNQKLDENFFITNIAFIDKLICEERESFFLIPRSVRYYSIYLYRNFIVEHNIFSISDTALSCLIKNEALKSDTRQKLVENFNKNVKLINTILYEAIKSNTDYHVHRFLFESIYHTDFFNSAPHLILQDIINKIDIEELYHYIDDQIYPYLKKKLNNESMSDNEKELFYLNLESIICSDLQMKKSLHYLELLDLIKEFNLNITDFMISGQLHNMYRVNEFMSKSSHTTKRTPPFISREQNLLKEQSLFYEMLSYLLYDFLKESLDNFHLLCSDLITHIFDEEQSDDNELSAENKNMELALEPEYIQNSNLIELLSEEIKKDKQNNLNYVCKNLANMIDNLYNCKDNENKRPQLKTIKDRDVSYAFKRGNAFIFPYLLKKDRYDKKGNQGRNSNKES